MEVTVVIAGNYSEFSEWCKNIGINIKNPLIRYIEQDTGIFTLYGYRDLNVAYVGTYYKRNDISDIEKFIATRRRG